jgi:hypothetical protein
MDQKDLDKEKFEAKMYKILGMLSGAILVALGIFQILHLT